MPETESPAVPLEGKELPEDIGVKSVSAEIVIDPYWRTLLFSLDSDIAFAGSAITPQ